MVLPERDSLIEPKTREQVIKRDHVKNSRFFNGVRTAVFLSLSALLICGLLQTHLLQKGNLLMVEVNGLQIGLLSSEEELSEILNALKEEAADYYGMPVRAEEEVTLEEIFLPLEKGEPEKVFAQLRNILSYKVAARMVSVNGKDVLPLSSDNEVVLLYEQMASAFTPNSSNVLLENVEVGEKITTRDYYCYPEDITDVETLAAILLRGTDRREVYLVSRGDSLWKIARDYSLSVDELKEANPQIQGDRLQIGDEISLIVPEPMVNVYTVERLTIEEKIPFGIKYVNDDSLWMMQTKIIEAGEQGIKEIVYQVTRENGIETSRTILYEEVVQEPKTQLVAQGTATIPSKGTGSFVWPVAGGGRMTSGYGWRSGGFHSGIDIAARKGVSVLAADNGVVVFSGWDGGYGNCVVISHGNNYYTRYGHNTDNLVSVGQTVAKGDTIATIGITGRASGYHLHFEVRTGGVYGTALNPLDFFSPR